MIDIRAFDERQGFEETRGPLLYFSAYAMNTELWFALCSELSAQHLDKAQIVP